jgi:hypothetical protein
MLLPGLVCLIAGVLGIIFHKSIAKFQYDLNEPLKNNYIDVKTFQTLYLIGGIIFTIIGILLLGRIQ